MVRYIREHEVEQILTMAKAVALVEQALRDRAEGRAVDVPRVRTRTAAGTLHILQGASSALKMTGYKAYYSARGKKTTYHVNLFDADSGKLIAIIEASQLGMVRTGAASGVATRYLARKDAAVVGMIGAGKQATGQLQAVCEVRKIREVRVYSRNAERARAFCSALSGKLGVEMHAVSKSRVVSTLSPCRPYARASAAKSGLRSSVPLTRRELDADAVKRCAPVVVDSRGTARNESGDLLPLVDIGLLDWDMLPELGEVIIGRVPGRAAHDAITLYESHGMYIQDLYTGKYVLETALQQGIGVDLPIGV